MNHFLLAPSPPVHLLPLRNALLALPKRPNLGPPLVLCQQSVPYSDWDALELGLVTGRDVHLSVVTREACEVDGAGVDDVEPPVPPQLRYPDLRFPPPPLHHAQYVLPLLHPRPWTPQPVEEDVGLHLGHKLGADGRYACVVAFEPATLVLNVPNIVPPRQVPPVLHECEQIVNCCRLFLPVLFRRLCELSDVEIRHGELHAVRELAASVVSEKGVILEPLDVDRHHFGRLDEGQLLDAVMVLFTMVALVLVPARQLLLLVILEQAVAQRDCPRRRTPKQPVQV
mmetsp:Transcript_46082/g.110970  ORF Transcript_46082/g.110970 Transcript_46082/m.110970 type:complete len:284 (+) Transcript_46082:467-1318(+)